MKGNNGTGNVAERDDWKTPKELWDQLNKIHEFNFDCCASEENTKCKNWSYKFEEVKDLDTTKVCWMNPPFSKSYDMFKHFFKTICYGMAIYRCDNMETKVWQEIILANATWIFIPKGRISYEGKEGKGSRFPSALIGFNLKPVIPKGLEGHFLHLS